MKTRALWAVLTMVVGCGGSSFVGSDDPSMGADAAIEASEVDTQTPPITAPEAGADMRAEGEASAPTEASIEASVDAGIDSDDSGNDGSTVPTCGADEVYPQASPTCEKWIHTTPWPLMRACCRKETHTCGMIVTFSPFCVEAK
jgi:hypothetical protein